MAHTSLHPLLAQPQLNWVGPTTAGYREGRESPQPGTTNGQTWYQSYNGIRHPRRRRLWSVNIIDINMAIVLYSLHQSGKRHEIRKLIWHMTWSLLWIRQTDNIDDVWYESYPFSIFPNLDFTSDRWISPQPGTTDNQNRYQWYDGIRHPCCLPPLSRKYYWHQYNNCALLCVEVTYKICDPASSYVSYIVGNLATINWN